MENNAYPGFLASDIPPSSCEKALIHIIPAEMEKSVSYGAGASAGPKAILAASLQLEAYDGISIPGRVGLHTHSSLECRAENAADDLEVIAAEVSGVLKNNGIPVILGGEHTVTLGALKSFKRSRKNFGVVQFDAHADLRDSYENNPLSHACTMRRVHDMGIPFMQIGIRSLSAEEDVFRRKNKIKCLEAQDLYERNIPDPILPMDFPELIYITFDVDCFDSSIMPATGTPEPGGLNWYQVMDLLRRVAAKRKICGFDVVELAPIPGMPAPDFTAAKLVYKLIGLVADNH